MYIRLAERILNKLIFILLFVLFLIHPTRFFLVCDLGGKSTGAVRIIGRCTNCWRDREEQLIRWAKSDSVILRTLWYFGISTDVKDLYTESNFDLPRLRQYKNICRLYHVRIDMGIPITLFGASLPLRAFNYRPSLASKLLRFKILKSISLSYNRSSCLGTVI